MPILDRFESELQLLSKPVLLVLSSTTLFQFEQFHTFHHMTIRVVRHTQRPTTSNVVVEQTATVRSQISRTVIVCTSPLQAIIHLCPISQFSTNLRISSITLEVIATMFQKTLLVHVVTTYQILNILRTTADRNVVFVSRNILTVEFIKPVSVTKCVTV